MSVLCAVSDIPDAAAIRVPCGEGSVIVARDGEAIFVYENRCPHFGIPLDVGRGIKVFRKHLLCVNHYAAFRFADGACVEGPCLGASLAPVAFHIEDGRVVS